MTAAARLLGALSTLALWLSGIGLVAMTGAVAWLVFGRYVLNDSPVWSEPLALVLMSWFIFLGAAVGVREGTHLGFDVLRAVSPRPVAAAMATASDLVVAAFGGAMALHGGQLMVRTWDAPLPSLGLPTGVNYVPVTLGGALFVLFALERIARRIAGLEPAAAGTAAGGRA
jgi:TRAP-type C4-dicarboxylate transport system permease small subunit